MLILCISEQSYIRDKAIATLAQGIKNIFCRHLIQMTFNFHEFCVCMCVYEERKSVGLSAEQEAETLHTNICRQF